MFYTYNQNNSGGSFDLTESLTHHVIIEANSSSEADSKLESLGGYFNGCDSGRDCDCCGDRWSNAWHNDGEPEPMAYGKKASEYVGSPGQHNWMPAGKEVVVHYADGTVAWY